jgi:hypothetical protein
MNKTACNIRFAAMLADIRAMIGKSIFTFGSGLDVIKYQHSKAMEVGINIYGSNIYFIWFDLIFRIDGLGSIWNTCIGVIWLFLAALLSVFG